jgi:hypothetical protein
MPQLSSNPSSNPRPLTQLNPVVEKTLLSYAALASAAGVGVMALSQPSEAKIVYTATHQVIAANTTLQIDLNGDGTNDFFLSNRFVASPRGQTSSFRTSAALSINPVAKTNQVWGHSGFVSAMPAGIVVGSKGKFAPSQYFMGGVSALDGNHPIYQGQWAPPEGSVKNHYVDMKFVINGEIHYGWARLSVQIRQTKNGGAQAVLTGYAYETIANRGLETGKTSGADAASAKSGSLGQLALGAENTPAVRKENE